MIKCKYCIHGSTCGLYTDENGNKWGEVQMCLMYYDASNIAYLPCKIGDKAWGIRGYKSHGMIPRLGEVVAMEYSDTMKLVVTLKGVCRGIWGAKVFSTKAEAEAAIAELKEKHLQTMAEVAKRGEIQ